MTLLSTILHKLIVMPKDECSQQLMIYYFIMALSLKTMFNLSLKMLILQYFSSYNSKMKSLLGQEGML